MMLTRRIIGAVICAHFAISSVSAGDEPIDWSVVNKIRDEGFNRSEVMETISYMTDVIGPRLTGSPAMRQANDWALEKLENWGLKNGHLEAYEFGRGWTYSKSVVRMIAPRISQLQAIPISWHPATDGVIKGRIIKVSIESEADFAQFSEGQLKDKIVLLTESQVDLDRSDIIQGPFNDETLGAYTGFAISGSNSVDDEEIDDFVDQLNFPKKLYDFLHKQGAIAVVKGNRRDGALLSAEGGLHKVGETPEIPAVSVALEDYEQLLRLLDRGMEVALEIEVNATFYDGDTKAYNTIAEIPGKGRKPEIVVGGAHMDSWFMGDGAVDNATGTAVVMEAARILTAIGVKPKRTIRFGLWSGEEQGMQGSLYHVMTNYADKPIPDDPELAALTPADWYQKSWPLRLKDEYERLSVYFNLDTGAGKIRGLYGEGNVEAKRIFESWFEPFHDVDAKTVTLNSTPGTDHEAFQFAGLPGFTFIQDYLEYNTRLHHTQVDTFDHIREEDMKQASVIMASFLYHAAMRDERIPRMARPQKPK